MPGVLALNLHTPTPERARALLEYLWLRDEDVLVLSELTGSPGSKLVLDVCRAAGHQVVVAPVTGKERGVALVVRNPDLAVTDEDCPAGARVVAASVGGIRVVGVYGAASDPVRYSSSAQRERKRAWLREFRDVVAVEAGRPGPLLVTGDLNIVDPDDGPGLPYVLEEERAAYAELEANGLTDAYRLVAGASRVTWADHSGVGCRYDHAFVRGLDVASAEIDDEPRTAGHTDHSVLAVQVELPG